MIPHMDRTITSLDLPATLVAAFEHEWIEAWNAHDIDRILLHYRDDVRFVSPIAAAVCSAASTSPGSIEFQRWLE